MVRTHRWQHYPTVRFVPSAQGYKGDAEYKLKTGTTYDQQIKFITFKKTFGSYSSLRLDRSSYILICL